MGSSRGCPEAQRGQGLGQVHVPVCIAQQTWTLKVLACPGEPQGKAEVKMKVVLVLRELQVLCVKVTCPTGRQPSDAPVWRADAARLNPIQEPPRSWPHTHWSVKAESRGCGSHRPGGVMLRVYYKNFFSLSFLACKTALWGWGWGFHSTFSDRCLARCLTPRKCSENASLPLPSPSPCLLCFGLVL